MTPVTSTTELKPGDVLVVDVTLTDRATGQDKVWRRYACVLRLTSSLRRRIVEVMTLKMQIDPAKDIRVLQLDDRTERRERLWLLPEDKWPPGVVAMRMKHIAQGRIKLGGE